ncbi:MAG: FKBP-type peptidyl-prolyl cis-trans isomerase [Chitinophagaceae bacterium]|nr:FKBP-type peptidyl-prolyl cis-trans isomerase [Chitinophagaceae bacterium]
MKNYIVGTIIIITILTACGKSEDGCAAYDPCAFRAPETEITRLEDYLDSTQIMGAIKHCSGMYYKVLSEGTGAKPEQCSSISVDYKGQLADGMVFDSTQAGSPAKFTLIGLIEGWKIGIPLIKQGGTIRLFIPPSLGYGYTSDPRSPIPAGSMLVFDVALLKVQ